jgi:hypothetical protein
LLSASGDERHDDVGSMPVEVLSAPVIDRGRPRIGVSGGDLDITQRDAGIQRRHDEGGAEHVRVD